MVSTAVDMQAVKELIKKSKQAKREAAESAECAAEHVFYLQEAARLCPDNNKIQKEAEAASNSLPSELLPALERLRASSGGAPAENTPSSPHNVPDQAVSVEDAPQTKQHEMHVLLERKVSTPGRGHGMFANRDIKRGQVAVRVRPALSVIFDSHVDKVCGFCFASGRGAGIQKCSGGCGAFAVCKHCAANEQLTAWHATECEAFKAAPAAAKKGDSSVLRMLLRYKASMSSEWADSSMGKEPLAILEQLDGHLTNIPEQSLAGLSKLTGLPTSLISRLIFQIRTNAASIERNDSKAGCSLSGFMGFSNHDCDPSLQATFDDDGFLTLKATRDIEAGQEACISYVDTKMPLAQRRQVLSEHYKFVCQCQKCQDQEAAIAAKELKKKEKKEKKKKKK